MKFKDGSPDEGIHGNHSDLEVLEAMFIDKKISKKRL